MSLARITTFQLPIHRRQALIASGELSELAAIRPFAPLAAYDGLVPLPTPTGEPLLDRPLKPNGAINLHHLAYVRIADRYRADALVTMNRAPGAYLLGVLRAGRRFCSPSSEYGPLARNRRLLAGLDGLYNALVHFEWPGLGAVGWMLLLLPGSIAFGMIVGWRRWRSREVDGALLLFLAGNIVYVGAVGCLFEVGENNRFRFLVEPYLWILTAIAARAGARWWLGQRARRG